MERFARRAAVPRGLVLRARVPLFTPRKATAIAVPSFTTECAAARRSRSGGNPS